MAEGFAVTALFYNPNIHPVAEYARRRDALAEYAATLGLPVIVKDKGYDPAAWFRRVSFREDNRCFHCLHMRLEETSFIARAGGFSHFTTTLHYSSRQKHETIAAHVRHHGGDEKNSPIFYRDFRAGWAEGIEESKHLGMYRQDYCGCLFSDLERRKELLQG